ncbi:Glutamate decarboxylase [Planctomycetes bacterium Pan216]|uniref:Glutamate decarboxylase n=1 Tax=Kolteria novifilia TaxID=2527975 RepID=A0A518B0T0_9BACT|nr:Glutamate decarboxylase [Planctomycetes bacterium Pan216]
MLSKQVPLHEMSDSQKGHSVTYGTRYFTDSVPKYEMPDDSMPANVAYQIIHDELDLDGNPRLNLASFVTTWMEPEAEKLMMESLNKNYIDQDEYPQTTEIQNRCVNMLSRLFNSPNHETAVGTGTVGSSEAIHLAGLALKWNWRARQKAKGKPTDKPNIVMGENVQVCWEKFARYFEVEPRLVPLTESRFILGVDEALEMVDENTIAVVGILGSTYTGEFEPIKELNDKLTKLNEEKGWEVPIHVDGASGAFVAPFLYPDLEWDFRLPLVKSINASGHKYGLVHPGVGWVIWRDEAELPDDLVFHVNYLGGDQPTFNLNFSKGASQVIAQYYNFLRLGYGGYKRIMENMMDNCRFLVSELGKSDHFDFLSDDKGLPVVCFGLKGERGYTVFDISDRLRERGWIVPAYTMAPNAEHIAVLRIVVREGFSRDMAELLVEDIKRAVEYFDEAKPQVATSTPHEKKTKGVC